MVSAGTGSEPDLFWIEPLTAAVGAVGVKLNAVETEEEVRTGQQRYRAR